MPSLSPRVLFTALALAGVGCGPPVLRGTADLRLREVLFRGDARAEALVALLAADAEVHRQGEVARGPSAAAEALVAVQAAGGTRVYRHHDVSLVVLGDGRVLFVQRNAADQVSRVAELREPEPADGMTRTAIFYDRAWNADDPRARLDLLHAAWAKSGRYVDPQNDALGPEGLSAAIGRFRLVFPGARVKSTSGVADSGGGWVTFDWVIKSRVGKRTLYEGFDVAHLDADGKIALVAGFFGSRYGDAKN